MLVVNVSFEAGDVGEDTTNWEGFVCAAEYVN
jgi:hypothetical protein